MKRAPSPTSIDLVRFLDHNIVVAQYATTTSTAMRNYNFLDHNAHCCSELTIEVLFYRICILHGYPNPDFAWVDLLGILLE